MTEANSTPDNWNKILIHPDIKTVGDPILRQKAEKVENIEEVKDLCDHLVDILQELNGAGLAAPQVGKSLRIFALQVKKTELFPDRHESPLYVMINPEIMDTSEEKEVDWEGCFSVPGLRGEVSRPKSITMKYTSPDGKEHIDKFEGFLARIMQHEYDHLEGIIYLDKLVTTKSIVTNENWRKSIIESRIRSI